MALYLVLEDFDGSESFVAAQTIDDGHTGVFDGATQDVTVGPTGIIVWDDTYDDSGTTSRVVYITTNIAATGFVAGYYVGFELGFSFQ